jgi:ABC-type spermidine/putrescine transport system permease subunit I
MKNSSSPFRSNAMLLLAPALLFIFIFFVVPLVWCFLLSFMTPGSVEIHAKNATLANYIHFLTDGFYLKDLLWKTVWLSLGATIVAIAVGYMGALVITRAPENWQSTLIFLVMCPLWVNLVVRTLSLMVLLGRNGPINQVLIYLGITNHSIQLLYNETAVFIGMVQVSVPFVVISLHGVLKSIGRELEQAAMTVGATAIQAFLRVTLPLSVPGIMAGGILALGLNMESFIVPTILGGGRVHFMSAEAYDTATVGNNLPFAAAIGMILLIVTLGILAVYRYIAKSMGRISLALRAA